MENNPSMNEPASEKVGMTAVEEFMANGYEFRKNVLSDKYEMREINGHWRVVTRESINSISRRLKREVDEEKNWRSEVEEYIHSEETPCYDPIVEYLDSLPTWDGKDRVRELFRRLPGANDEQLAWLAVWLRSAVAHWLHLDPLHGNENIVTLIGPQGCGKTTFCCQLLPPQFRSYYLDHVNLGNKFDKEMALTNNLLVNIDELDQIKPGKQAELKQMVSKNKVNGRPIFGRAQNDRFRFASFVATTNNPRPLHDPTGSRRYLCVEIPHGSIICNELPIEYDQLFAQVVYELRDQHLPYWFTPAEVIRMYRSRLFDVHLRDIADPANGSSGALPHRGHVDYVSVFRALREVGYSEWCGLELAAAFAKPNAANPGADPSWIPQNLGYFRGLMDAI